MKTFFNSQSNVNFFGFDPSLSFQTVEGNENPGNEGVSAWDEKGTSACASIVFSHLNKFAFCARAKKSSMQSQQNFSAVGVAKFQPGLKLTI